MALLLLNDIIIGIGWFDDALLGDVFTANKSQSTKWHHYTHIFFLYTCSNSLSTHYALL